MTCIGKWLKNLIFDIKNRRDVVECKKVSKLKVLCTCQHQPEMKLSKPQYKNHVVN